jgi:hypothetical protein
MSNQNRFDGEQAMERLLRHAYRLKRKEPEEIKPQYQKTAVMDLRTLRKEIKLINEQFGEAYGVDVKFDFDVDAGVLTPRDSSDADSEGPAADEELREVLEENEDLFRRIATNDDLSSDFRETFGHGPLDKLEELRSETE